MILSWSEAAWEDYIFWQDTDKKILKRINTLLVDISRDPYKGIGGPEPLKYNWTGYWSRRINQEHRLVYKLDQEKNIVIVQCRYHY